MDMVLRDTCTNYFSLLIRITKRGARIYDGFTKKHAMTNIASRLDDFHTTTSFIQNGGPEIIAHVTTEGIWNVKHGILDGNWRSAVHIEQLIKHCSDQYLYFVFI